MLAALIVGITPAEVSAQTKPADKTSSSDKSGVYPQERIL